MVRFVFRVLVFFFVCVRDVRRRARNRPGSTPTERVFLVLFAYVVEELSQAASDSRPVAEESEVKISQADMDFIKATKETLASARAATEVSDDVLKKIEAAAKGMKEVTKKINSSRMAQLDKALDEALAAAKTCTDDCAVAWETVEEIRYARMRARIFESTTLYSRRARGSITRLTNTFFFMRTHTQRGQGERKLSVYYSYMFYSQQHHSVILHESPPPLGVETFFYKTSMIL